MTAAVQEKAGMPDMKVSVRQVFGIESDMEVPAFSQPDAYVPDLDPDYRFDRPTTLAILADQIHAFATHRTHAAPGVNGHQGRDGHRACSCLAKRKKATRTVAQTGAVYESAEGETTPSGGDG